jgi:hypothetical protein
MRSPEVANLTLVVEDDVLLRARRRALDQGTSVNAVVRSYLESYAGGRDRAAAMRAFLDRAAASTARSKRQYTREDLHER